MAVDALDARAGAVVIEAIVENLDAKRALFARAGGDRRRRRVLATNTSSLSVTAIAHGLKRPAQRRHALLQSRAADEAGRDRIGPATAPPVADALFDLAQRWGKTPVHARSTPGFIVNRIAPSYYAEALVLLHERRAKPAAIDACLRGAGFRMGPCELMDLIGHDVNFAVTQSVFAANFSDQRYAPGWCSKKSSTGRAGPQDAAGLLQQHRCRRAQEAAAPSRPPAVPRRRDRRAARPRLRPPIAGRPRLEAAERRRFDGRPGEPLERTADRRRRLRLTRRPRRDAGAAVDGVPRTRRLRYRRRARRRRAGTSLALAFSASASAPWREQAVDWLAIAGWHAERSATPPGLIVARTVAMLSMKAPMPCIRACARPRAPMRR